MPLGKPVGSFEPGLFAKLIESTDAQERRIAGVDPLHKRLIDFDLVEWKLVQVTQRRTSPKIQESHPQPALN